METPAPPGRIGLDLDNTIIDYTALIREEIAALGLSPITAAGNKRALRDALRAIDGGEGHWTRLQARIYGPRLAAAVPFAGVATFVRRAVDAGYELAIVSHKSRLAAADTDGFDLHAAALAWLDAQGLVGARAIPRGNVFFESTRAAKIARIGALRLHAFIDDLSEVFAEPEFPAGVRRWLFDPGRCESHDGTDRVFDSWIAIQEHVLGKA